MLLADDGPRVIDFGISHAAEATSLTGTGFVVGSPGFMSPEQAEGRKVGPPSDIFSLGAVLVFAASGRGPFGAGSTAALVYRIVHASPDLDQLPAELRPLAGRCLAKDPGERPAASDLLAEVGAVQPAPGWLPESVSRASAGDTPEPPPTATSHRQSPSAAPAPEPSPPGGDRNSSRRKRPGLPHRGWRQLHRRRPQPGRQWRLPLPDDQRQVPDRQRGQRNGAGDHAIGLCLPATRRWPARRSRPPSPGPDGGRACSATRRSCRGPGSAR